MKTFEFTFEQPDIQITEIEELMGFETGSAPYPFSEWIKNELQNAPSLCKIKGGFKIFSNMIIDKQNETLLIEDQLFHPGKKVITQIKDATSAAIFVCTAGSGITDFKKTAGEDDNQIKFYIRDVIGSVTVEKAAEKIQGKIETVASERGLNISTPFSPGYCDWSVAEQHKLFELLPPGFCGITLSGSALMSPVKSISGITGIGTACKKHYNQCYWCEDRQCIYGKVRRKKNI